jgi:cell division protein FtsB
MTVWTAITRASIGILIVFGLVGVCYAYKKPVAERKSLLARKADMERMVTEQQTKLDDLKQRQERLQTDPRFVEKIAREEFGYSKPGEIVFKFDGDPSPRLRSR